MPVTFGADPASTVCSMTPKSEYGVCLLLCAQRSDAFSWRITLGGAFHLSDKSLKKTELHLGSEK